MDHIPFKKVTVEEARASLQHDALKTETALSPKKNWNPNRLPEPGDRLEDLTANTFKWLATLPKEARPNALALQYPRIANRLAELWKRQLQCERYLDDLMMDLRGDRKGFPPDVAMEIATLKGYFLKSASTVHYGIWGNRIGVD